MPLCHAHTLLEMKSPVASEPVASCCVCSDSLMSVGESELKSKFPPGQFFGEWPGGFASASRDRGNILQAGKPARWPLSESERERCSAPLPATWLGEERDGAVEFRGYDAPESVFVRAAPN